MKKFLILLLVLLLAGCTATPRATEYDKPVVALLDTGVSTVAIDPDGLLSGYNYVTDSGDTEDRLNHGTAVASILLGSKEAGVAGMAEGQCLILPLVVVDVGGSVAPEILAQAIRDSIDVYGANIINLSLGIKTDAEALREAVSYAEEQGILVVSAVGNEGGSDRYYPASYETVVAVGSHNKYGSPSDFSQRNGTADILAPGEHILMASCDGKPYGSRGTSFATGYVTACAVRLLAEDSNLRPAQLRERLYASATDIGENGWDSDSGWGLLQIQ